MTNLWTNYEGMDAHWLALYSSLYWFEITVGLVLPAELMANRGVRANQVIQAVAGLAFMSGMFIGRLEFLNFGLTPFTAVPQIALSEAAMKELRALDDEQLLARRALEDRFAAEMRALLTQQAADR